MVDTKPARASRTLARGESVEIEIPDQAPPRAIIPHHVPLRVVFEDEHLLVIDKPAGLVVHPAPGHWDDTLVNALAARGTAGGGGVAGRPGIVHRLDRDTSGLMLVARTDEAHRKLSSAMAARTIRRAYAALAWGHFDSPRSTIEAAIGRHAADRKRMAIRTDGRAARTDVEVVARLDVCDLVRLTLHTGRTHQIRVHLQHAGHPILGDDKYGDFPLNHQLKVRRLMLHAASLAFSHPLSGAALAFKSPVPEEMKAFMKDKL